MRLIGAVLLMVASAAFAQADMPSQTQIDAMIQKQRQQTDVHLDRAVREALPSGAVKVQPLRDLGAAVAPKQDNLDDLLKQMNTAHQKKPGTDVMVFVSFSMPDAVLQQLSKQAKEAGAVFVLRGLKEGSLRKTQEVARDLNPGGVEWLIHPELFKPFKIKKVPAIVVADGGAGEILEDGCSPEATYAAVTGDVSIQAALDVIRRRARPSIANMAEQKLLQMSGRVR